MIELHTAQNTVACDMQMEADRERLELDNVLNNGFKTGTKAIQTRMEAKMNLSSTLQADSKDLVHSSTTDDRQSHVV